MILFVSKFRAADPNGTLPDEGPTWLCLAEVTRFGVALPPQKLAQEYGLAPGAEAANSFNGREILYPKAIRQSTEVKWPQLYPARLLADAIGGDEEAIKAIRALAEKNYALHLAGGTKEMTDWGGLW